MPLISWIARDRYKIILEIHIFDVRYIQISKALGRLTHQSLFLDKSPTLANEKKEPHLRSTHQACLQHMNTRFIFKSHEAVEKRETVEPSLVCKAVRIVP